MINKQLVMSTTTYNVKTKSNTEYTFSNKLELEKALGLRLPTYSFGIDIHNHKVIITNLNDVSDIFVKQELKLATLI